MTPIEKCELLANQSIDCKIRLQISERITIVGKIEKCQFNGWFSKPNQSKRHAIFEIVIDTGISKWVGTVLELPKADTEDGITILAHNFRDDVPAMVESSYSYSGH